MLLPFCLVFLIITSVAEMWIEFGTTAGLATFWLIIAASTLGMVIGLAIGERRNK